MTPDRIFSLCSTVALAGWFLLAAAGRRRWAASLVTGLVIPALFAVVYTWLILTHWGDTPGGFGSLSSVASLFSNRWMLLAGWIHYLAFDLFIGSWEVRDAQSRGVPHAAVFPALALTFLFGPAGLLAYLATRTALTRTAAPESNRAASAAGGRQ